MKRQLTIAILSSALALGAALAGVTASHARPATLQTTHRLLVPHYALILPGFRLSINRALPAYYIGRPALMHLRYVAERFAFSR